VAGELTDRYTVITYDRRGFSRSPTEQPPDDRTRLAIDGDDARALIERLSGAPAYVFGSSSGAIVGLELIVRYPDAVKRLVAHEPPLMTLLPETAAFLPFTDEVYDTYRSQGAGPAMQKFAAKIGLSNLDPAKPANLPPPVLQMLQRIRGNDSFFLEHELRQYPRAVPDLGALQKLADRIVLAGGVDSRTFVPYLPNTALARSLGRSIVDFPGGHVGYTTHPAPFAAQLAAVLET
jgi:pimeloyl-ACP methyl ester carboxylesterase